MESWDQFKSIATKRPFTGRTGTLDDDIARLGAALAAGAPIDDDLRHTLFGQIVWPVALGRPPGDLAAAFDIRCACDNWNHYPQDWEEVWTPFPRTPCAVRVAEGLGDEKTWWVNFAATHVPDSPAPADPSFPVYAHFETTVANPGEWTDPRGRQGIAQAGGLRVVPSPLAVLTGPGLKFLEFGVIAGRAH